MPAICPGDLRRWWHEAHESAKATEHVNPVGALRHSLDAARQRALTRRVASKGRVPDPGERGARLERGRVERQAARGIVSPEARPGRLC
jgi:hypothetical protein